uniref:NHERF family PDZ scaffold protein 2 n=1 Tax=Labrus bergylta TaxID=56723 RepID=A0A3Q3E693_9LABR
MNNLNEFELTLSNKTKVIFCIIKKVLTSLPGRSCPGRSALPVPLAPRLCHLARTEMGYVHPLPGPGSPADHAGLRPQDRLVEVNGVNIEGMRHAEVVAFIKKGGDETWLLVVDPDTDDHFKRRGVVPSVTEFTSQSVLSTFLSVSISLPPPQLADEEGNRLLDPFAEMGLSLSATAAEEKMKVHSKEKRKAPQMDWMKKYELFSNF